MTCRRARTLVCAERLAPVFAGRADPLATGLRRSLDIETAYARDYDAVHARLRLGLMAAGVLLLPFWLKRRANLLVAAGQLGEPAMLALARPWAAWLLQVAAIAVLYDVQGPDLRQQLLMLLAWIPVFGLLQRRILGVVGLWAYLSAVFYFLNVVLSQLIADPVLFRFALLAITLLMLVPLAWHVRQTGRRRVPGRAVGADLRRARRWHRHRHRPAGRGAQFRLWLILMFERPIHRGDTVEVAGMEGTVREIGLRATIVTTFDGADVVVPNGMLLADKLELDAQRHAPPRHHEPAVPSAPSRSPSP